MELTDDARRKIRRDFRRLVNLSPRELERWLGSEQSWSVGERSGAGKGESTGHRSGRRIVAIKRTRVADLTDADYRHMHRVINYIKRHAAQRPARDVRGTRWRYSLMNWGHDPLK